MGKLKVANCTFCGKNAGTMVLLHCLGQVTLATPTRKVISTPVGVLVFDAKTGGVTSVNREAKRIVTDLCAPGGSAEQLLEVLTFRRADGREVSLEEFLLALALTTGETVRAEEIILQAPDGRSVTTLINATPIFSEEGETWAKDLGA